MFPLLKNSHLTRVLITVNKRKRLYLPTKRNLKLFYLLIHQKLNRKLEILF